MDVFGEATKLMLYGMSGIFIVIFIIFIVIKLLLRFFPEEPK